MRISDTHDAKEKKKQIFCQKIATCKIVYPEEPFGVHACLF